MSALEALLAMGVMPDVDERPMFTGVMVTFLVVCWVTTALRCYVKVFLVRSFRIEDHLALLSMMLLTFTIVAALMGMSWSHGNHVINLDLDELTNSMMWWILTELGYVATTTILRISIGIFIMRLAIKKSHVILIWCTLTSVVAYGIAYFGVVLFQCVPISYFWLQYSGKPGSCMSPVIFGDLTYTHTAISALADWTLAVLPMFIVWKLQMNIRTKIVVVGILAMGAFASIALLIRIPYVKALVESLDFTFVSVNVALWTVLEPGLGVIAASTATLRPLVRTFLSHTKLWGADTSKGNVSTFPGSSDYLRSKRQKTKTSDDDIDLEMGVLKTIGVTTTCESKPKRSVLESGLDTFKSIKSPATKSGSEDGLTSRDGAFSNFSVGEEEMVEEKELSWSNGIQKTVHVCCESSEMPTGSKTHT